MPRSARSPRVARPGIAHGIVLSIAATVAVLAALAVPVGAPAAANAAALTSANAAAAPLTSATVHSADAATVFSGGPYLQAESQPAKYAAQLAAAGDTAGATAARTISRYPIAIWLGDWFTDAQLVKLIQTTQAAAAAAGTTPVYVTYAIPNRDCGGYSAGGFTADGYEQWTDRIAATLRGQRAAVIVEPDSLAALSSCASEASTRYALLSHEVSTFTAAGIPSYLDAGNENWVQPAEMASRLRNAGVADARGFFTNVANYYPTATEQAYAEKVSALTGGAHYVIDTSRNGTGWRGDWCNGVGAGLGSAPAVASGSTRLDATLWVKTPGASDGTCNGGPAAGSWFSSYAQALVANAVTAAPSAAGSTGATPDGTAGSGSAAGSGSTAGSGATPAKDPARNPRGSLDEVRGTSLGVTVRGWAWDPDASGGTGVDVWDLTSGARYVASTSTSTSRPDVASAVAGAPGNTGFTVTVPMSPGTHTICAYGINVGAGTDNPRLGCTTVSVARDTSHDPKGSLDAVTATAGGAVVHGWVFDPDAAGASSVDYWIDGGFSGRHQNGSSRPDVASAYPGATSTAGFDTTVRLTPGTHTVCAYGINTGAGTGDNPLLGCRSVTVSAGAVPRGSLDSVTGGVGGVSLWGWAWDADAGSDALQVDVWDQTAGNRYIGSVTTGGSRPDVAAAVPGATGTTGFAGDLPLGAGTHTVCAYAIDVPGGDNPLLGCGSVTVR